jgi:hypothetical protein
MWSKKQSKDKEFRGPVLYARMRRSPGKGYHVSFHRGK